MRFVLLLSLALEVGCASAPDVPVCVEINPSKAYCINTISEKEFVVDDNHKFENLTYWELRPLMLLVPASSWAKIKAYIIKSCRQSNQCDESIGNWSGKVESIDSVLKR